MAEFPLSATVRGIHQYDDQLESWDKQRMADRKVRNIYAREKQTHICPKLIGSR